MNQARLVVEGRGNWVYTHHIGDAEKITIGRAADNDVRLGDLHSSSRHAEIICKAGEYYCRDLGSRNGTYVNGEKISGEAKLKNGHNIKVGITTMSFLTGEDESFCTSVSAAMAPAKPKAAPDPESALQPMIERLDTLKYEMGQSKSANAEALLSEAVEDLQQELRDAKATIRRLAMINEFHRVLAVEGTPLQVLSRALNFMAHHVGAENGFIMQVDPTTRKWAVRARFGQILDWSRATEEGEDKQQSPMSLTIVERAISSGKPIVSQSALDDSRFDAAHSVVTLGIRSCLCFPMFSNGEPAGVAYVDRRSNPAPFGIGEEKLFEALTGELNQVLYAE
jgi:sigma-B regulation protein RsbU (phosphoserine phosphatase)